MSATKRFSQTPPDKANELFDKLLATSDNAIKTRERLLADLKEELTLLASLQEEHLFPVLRRHGMQDLVREATNDNEATGALMAELERMPKNSQRVPRSGERAEAHIPAAHSRRPEGTASRGAQGPERRGGRSGGRESGGRDGNGGREQEGRGPTHPRAG